VARVDDSSRPVSKPIEMPFSNRLFTVFPRRVNALSFQFIRQTQALASLFGRKCRKRRTSY
jgi:hypothetical protein